MMGHLWLRCEYKKNERRTPLIPKHAASLIKIGHLISVEESSQRVFSIDEYRNAGCQIVPSGSWESAPYDAYILGLKNLPDSHQPLRHKHIYFAHSFKAQLHSKWLLRRFRKGGGILYDLEYLINDEGKRVAAFGFYAGVAGAAIALMIWALKQQKKSPYKIPKLYLSQNEMIKDIQALLSAVKRKPSVLIIGASGRSGLGASNLIKQLGIDAIYWGREKTQNKNFKNEILNFDILLNCVLVDKDTPCFLTLNDLSKKNNQLSVICDVSCDPESKYNPLPFYNEINTFDNPTQKFEETELISIDNLPSYLPVESSINFSEQLVSHLNDLLQGNINNTAWNAAANSFREYSMNYIIENRIVNNYENTNTKNIIVIVSAYSSGALLAPLFNGRGYACVHLTTRREWDIIRLRSYYREEEFFDNFILDSKEDIEKIINKLKNYNIKLIIPGCESGVNLADKLAEHFNTPKNDYKKTITRRNKFFMTEAIKSCGLLHINQMRSNALKNILEWFDNNRYKKIVLKPLSSSSSDSVFYCENHNEIAKAFANIYKNSDMYNELNDEVLAQEFIDGDEYIVNTVSRDGLHRVSDIWRGVSRDKNIVSNDIYADYVHPDKDEYEVLSGYVKKVLDALGIQNGPAHSEIRLTSQGPCLIETGARLAGKVDFSVVENICGVSQISLTAQAFLEPDLFNSRAATHKDPVKYARYVYFSSDVEGVVKQDPSFDAMLSIESLSAVYFVISKGDELHRTSKNFRTPRPGYAYLVSEDLVKTGEGL